MTKFISYSFIAVLLLSAGTVLAQNPTWEEGKEMKEVEIEIIR